MPRNRGSISDWIPIAFSVLARWLQEMVVLWKILTETVFSAETLLLGIDSWCCCCCWLFQCCLTWQYNFVSNGRGFCQLSMIRECNYPWEEHNLWPVSSQLLTREAVGSLSLKIVETWLHKVLINLNFGLKLALRFEAGPAWSTGSE